MALRRRTRVLRTVGWLVCQVIEIPNIDDVDQAALDTHIAALASATPRDACPRPSRDLDAAPWLKRPARVWLAAETDHAPHTAGTGLASTTRRARGAACAH
jgi:hypothetical protein